MFVDLNSIVLFCGCLFFCFVFCLCCEFWFLIGLIVCVDLCIIWHFTIKLVFCGYCASLI